MNDTLLSLVYERLERSGAINEPWSSLVMAACEGPAAVEHVLDRGAIEQQAPTPPVEAPEPPGVFLGPIAVAGFRGVGKRATLDLSPGPGLTLVVGRNGSGKSSFAEALELLLTGENRRWSGRTKAWSEGWRNLHVAEPCEIEARLSVEGTGVTTVRRDWPPEADLQDADTVVQPHGKQKTTLDALGWAPALETHRPFLSYNELGSMLDEGPSKLYDALARVLGLEDLVEADAALAGARKERQRATKAVREGAKALHARTQAQAEGSDDGRLTRAVTLLGARKWDLDALEQLTEGTGEGDADEDLALLKQCATLAVPDAELVERVGAQLVEASTFRAAFRGTEAEHAGELASLLDVALDYHQKHDPADCPVCGRDSALGQSWREETAKQVDRLRELGQQCDQAVKQLAGAMRAASDLVKPPPAFLTAASDTGLDTSVVITAWADWTDGAKTRDPDALAAHLQTAAPPLRNAVATLAASARDELERREDVWRPLARELTAWLVQARAAATGAAVIPSIKKAEDWFKDTADLIRAERFRPIAGQTKAVWAKLRHRSNVDLENVVLAGAKTQRRVELEVNVDGVETAALGVMSQGELHALALSLFLPRAMLPESPFRFIVIDDPVQSMDPARVDGLAHTLADVARDRQVVVFTHDDRLPEAVRRMQIEATVITVTRKPGSVVDCRPALSPIHAHLFDAHALAKDEALPSVAKARVIPGLCRSALEAYFVEVVRRRRLDKGRNHADVETEVAAANTLNKRAALALFDDVGKTGDVLTRLNKLGGWAGDTFKECNQGAHHGFNGDLLDLVKRSGNLIDRLRETR